VCRLLQWRCLKSSTDWCIRVGFTIGTDRRCLQIASRFPWRPHGGHRGVAARDDHLCCRHSLTSTHYRPSIHPFPTINANGHPFSATVPPSQTSGLHRVCVNVDIENGDIFCCECLFPPGNDTMAVSFEPQVYAVGPVSRSPDESS
jgi:hypothetical protein